MTSWSAAEADNFVRGLNRSATKPKLLCRHRMHLKPLIILRTASIDLEGAEFRPVRFELEIVTFDQVALVW
jgi:hypothetical protein